MDKLGVVGVQFLSLGGYSSCVFKENEGVSLEIGYLYSK